MDKETEIRRTINYIRDLIEKSDAIVKRECKDDYYEYYRNYIEVVAYLNRTTRKNLKPIPDLIKPNIFNKRLGGLWTITVLALLNPFFAIMTLTLTFPISIPYLVLRGVFLSRTKKRIEALKTCLITIVNDLKAQRVEMISP